MSNPVIILHNDNTDEAMDRIHRRHPGAVVHTCNTYDALPGLIDEVQPDIVYSVRFNGTPSFPRDCLINAKSIRWISVGGSGTDHLQPWDTSNLTVTNAAGVAADMMAQFCIGAMLHFALNFPHFLEAKQQRLWRPAKVEPLNDKQLLVIGLGKTGCALGKRAKAFDMKTIGLRANPKPTEHFDVVESIDSLHQFLSSADYIAVCVPLLPSTRGLLGNAEFAQMKETCVLVDVSRGGVIEEAALLAALQSESIKGAALDVFETEPLPKDHPFWSMQNTLVTPHSSSVYEGWQNRSVDMFCNNLDRYMKGEPLENIVDPERGY